VARRRRRGGGSGKDRGVGSGAIDVGPQELVEQLGSNHFWPYEAITVGYLEAAGVCLPLLALIRPMG